MKNEASEKCDPPVLPRQRQIPRRIDDGIAQHIFTSVEDHYRKEYFEVIDAVHGDLQRRFLQKNFLFVRNLEQLLLNSANGKGFSLPQDFRTLYENDIDMQKLLLHLQKLPDAIKAAPHDAIQSREVTKVQTICNFFKEQPGVKSLQSEVHKLLKLYLTIPVTTSTAERSFSALKRIKTYLRSSMTQQRLNHCMLLHVLRHKTDSLSLEDIAKDFMERNERRSSFFGRFS